jgi:hypothetical protein
MRIAGMRRVMKSIPIALTLFCTAPSYAGLLDKAPKTYNDCILQEMPKAQTKAAAYFIKQACKEKFAPWHAPSCMAWINDLRRSNPELTRDNYSDQEIYEYMVSASDRHDHHQFLVSCPP